MTRPGILPDIAHRMEARAANRSYRAIQDAVDRLGALLALGAVGYFILWAGFR